MSHYQLLLFVLPHSRLSYVCGRAKTTTFAVRLLVLVNALIDFVQTHDNVTPRRRSVSAIVRNCFRALIAAFTTVI